jgi:hypothetical protein
MRLPSVRFLSEPQLQRAPGGRYVLTSNMDAIVAGLRWSVPAGFITDGASVPAIFWPLVSNPMAPSSLRPAICHDYLYQRKGLGVLTRAMADRVFYAGLLAEGCAKPRAWAMYVAVRLFGPRW